MLGVDNNFTFNMTILTESDYFFYLQHNLVCDDALLTSHAKMIFYFGVLVGDLVFGVLADTQVLLQHP